MNTNSPTPKPKTLSVLVIEDNSLVRKVVCQMLKLNGFNAESADTGTLGILMAEKQDYDCILSDFGLPDLNGDKIARIIRTYEKKHNKQPTHMVVLSASVDKEQEALCLAAGIDQVFIKPLNAEIIEHIYAALRAKQTKT